MQTVKLGRTGAEVSVAGLGCGGASRLGMARGADVEQAAGVVRRAIELGVTVAGGAPHALSSRVDRHAPAARARAQAEDKVTSPRIAERSRLSRYRCEDNPTHGNALCIASCAIGAGTCRAARCAHR